MRARDVFASGDEISLGELLVYFRSRIREPALQRSAERLEPARRPGRLREGRPSGR